MCDLAPRCQQYHLEVLGTESCGLHRAMELDISAANVVTGVDRLNKPRYIGNIAPTGMEGLKILPLMYISRGHDV